MYIHIHIYIYIYVFSECQVASECVCSLNASKA